MEYRKTVQADVGDIMEIIKQAQAYFKEQGINQWQNNYPNNESILSDIEKGYGYVLVQNNFIIGTVAVSFDGEKTYDTIYEGQWKSNEEYAVIHRLAVSNKNKGMGTAAVIIKNIEENCIDRGINSIRVDTHKNNKSMQKMLQKNGFEYCGIIYLEDGNERMAFEKLL